MVVVHHLGFLNFEKFTLGRHYSWTFYLQISQKFETCCLVMATEACRHLQSGSTSTLFVPATRLSSLGDRAFPVAAARSWNTLPVSLQTV